MPRVDAERNLLFGILALQMDFITRDALIAAMNAWVLEKHRPIGEILVDRGALDPKYRGLLEPMVLAHVERHNGDPAASLAALSSVDSVASDLRHSIADPEVLESLAFVPPSWANDPYSTRAPEPSPPPSPCVRYTKLRNHAKGGLGVIFVAQDKELNREVALKEIQDRHADDPTSRARFLIEAEVTGGLEHPGIVPVYGLGSYEDGRPYYAMRFIRGDSLKESIAAFHADEMLKKDPGARSLALQKLLRRFLDVCNAIEYAHSRGVLHRDLKPENVMVGRYGETLVVDWGLAKAGGRSGDGPSSPIEALLVPASASGSGQTQPGSVIGTPAYMSPEQAEGRLDLLGPASDVYSLGATLYTLLTGEPPFGGKAIDEVHADVREGRFPRPRESAGWLDPPLEAVCLKAMSLRPEDRYPTPLALADDLERWLADEPVFAHRGSLLRRAGRWARRHRTAVVAAASTISVAAASILAFEWTQFERGRRAEAAGLATLARAQFLGAEARKTSDVGLWNGAIAEARRAEAQLESGGGGDAARSLARSRLAELQETLRVLERDRKMVADLDEARLSGANVKDGRFDHEAKADAILAAFRSYGIDLAKLSDEEAASRVRASRISPELVAALDEATPSVTKPLGKRLSSVARLADTDARGSDIRDRIARKDFAGLRRLVAEEAGRRELGARCRTIFTTLATRDPTASVPVLEAIHHASRGDFWLTTYLGRACQEARPSRLESAIRYYYAAAALKPTSPGVFQNLGVALESKGEHDGAIAAYREAIRLKPGYALAHAGLGSVLQSKGELDAAIDANREAIRLKPDFSEAHNNLGQCFRFKGNFDAAIAEYREAIKFSPNDGFPHMNLGHMFNIKGNSAGAIASCREGVRLIPDDAEAHNTLGLALRSKGELEEAIAEFRKAIQIKADDANFHTNLSLALRAKGDFGGAAASLREAVRLRLNAGKQK